MEAPAFPVRFSGSRRAAWMGALLFLGVGLGGLVSREEAGVFVGAIVGGLSFCWALYLLLRRPPTIVLHEDALEWRGRRVPWSAVTIGVVQSSTYDDFDNHAFLLTFTPVEAPAMKPVTIRSEQFPRWAELHAIITARVAAARRD